MSFLNYSDNDNQSFSNNESTLVPLGDEFEDDDAAWIMACIFIIFTMQTGFALMESGMCSLKNEVSTMIKNMIDVGIAGFVFWAFGYGIIYGESQYTTPFLGIGKFFFAPNAHKHGSGEEYLRFFMHCSYIANSNTIISGAMAERTNIKAYILYCFVNAILYCFPANWVWGKYGWLKQLGAIDVAGSGVVYGMGGFSALAGALWLKPRLGRNRSRGTYILGNAKNSLTGLFMIWWAFLALNSVSTFGVTEDKWMFSAKATVNTIISSFGGGFASLSFSLIFFCGHVNVPLISNCVFGSLVAISGSSVLLSTMQSFIVGIISAHITFTTMMIVEKSCLDDPCGAFSIHGLNGIWGLLSTGIFADRTRAPIELRKYNGLLSGNYEISIFYCIFYLLIELLYRLEID
ncbi:amt [Lepeophtheirus salmonis]|uniref:Amt n=1 Tax=Lepeophtheirus salmonis TaxID=72036 RepID=A0A0K2T970_LEPSM|nr:amt [Lepeophtheirus salmonis]CAF2877752.1 amt [Lepeophtheirus salmonis]